MSSASQVDLPSHLVSLVPGEWGIWRWFVLRGAGFPAADIERLAEPSCSLAADELIGIESTIEDRLQVAIKELNTALDRLTAAGISREQQAFQTVLAARRRLAKRKTPETAELDAEFGSLFRALESLLLKRQQRQSEFESIFASSVEHQSQVLKSFAIDPHFQEAVVWQNRRAFETAIRAIAEAPVHSLRNQSRRHREELIANYVQRYSVKNDTIGFFGPVAWGRIDSGEGLWDLSPGPSLLKSRHSYFENWALDRLALALSLIDGMEWWIPPRLAPHISIDGGRMSGTGAQDVSLDAIEMTVLPLCDGKRLPGEILALIQTSQRFRGFTHDQLSNFLRAKAGQAILVWRFLLPVEVNGERNLRQQLERIGDVGLRDQAIGHLDRLERARKKVEDSAGSPQRLNLALKELEEVFENLTRTSGRRNPGKTYGSRTILYEDCRRDLAARIDPQLLAPVIPALALLLRGYRWLVHSMALEFNRLFLQAYNEMETKIGAGDLPLMDWWIHVEPRLMDTPALSQIETVFKDKWAEILPIPGGESRVHFESRALREQAQELFPDLGLRCPFRYYCPDVLLAAHPEGIAKGEVMYVLGEIHLGKNTLLHGALVEQHPEREQLRQALVWDLASGSLKIIHTNEDETTTVRTTQGLFHPHDYMLATTPNSVPPAGFETWPISDLVLRRNGGELLVVSKRGARQFSILEAFADIFCSLVMNKASWSRPLPHIPRVQIDQLVIHRETWRARADELAFAFEKQPLQRFLGARRWMSSRGVTRRTFVKSPLEMKPFFLDLESPVLVEILCRTVRKLKNFGHPESKMAFSEMLPDIDKTWLRDATGVRYTAELRFAIVDMKTPEGGSLAYSETVEH